MTISWNPNVLERLRNHSNNKKDIYEEFLSLFRDERTPPSERSGDESISGDAEHRWTWEHSPATIAVERPEKENGEIPPIIETFDETTTKFISIAQIITIHIPHAISTFLRNLVEYREDTLNKFVFQLCNALFINHTQQDEEYVKSTFKIILTPVIAIILYLNISFVYFSQELIGLPTTAYIHTNFSHTSPFFIGIIGPIFDIHYLFFKWFPDFLNKFTTVKTQLIIIFLLAYGIAYYILDPLLELTSDSIINKDNKYTKFFILYFIVTYAIFQFFYRYNVIIKNLVDNVSDNKNISSIKNDGNHEVRPSSPVPNSQSPPDEQILSNFAQLSSWMISFFRNPVEIIKKNKGSLFSSIFGNMSRNLMNFSMNINVVSIFMNLLLLIFIIVFNVGIHNYIIFLICFYILFVSLFSIVYLFLISNFINHNSTIEKVRFISLADRYVPPSSDNTFSRMFYVVIDNMIDFIFNNPTIGKVQFVWFANRYVSPSSDNMFSRMFDFVIDFIFDNMFFLSLMGSLIYGIYVYNKYLSSSLSSLLILIMTCPMILYISIKYLYEISLLYYG